MKWYRILNTDNDEKYIQSALPIVPANNAASTAGATAYPTMPTVFRFDIPNTAGNYDFKMPFKVKVIDGLIDCVGATAPASGDTIALQNVTTAITDTKALGTTARAQLRFTTLSDASNEIAAGANLRVVAAKNTNCACSVYVTVLPVA